MVCHWHGNDIKLSPLECLPLLLFVFQNVPMNLKGVLCSLKGKKPNVLSLIRTHSGKWVLWMGALPPPLWGREGKRENWLRLLISSWKNFVCFFYYCFVFPPTEIDLIDLRGEPMEICGVCIGAEGGGRVMVYIYWEAFQVVGPCYTPTLVHKWMIFFAK